MFMVFLIIVYDPVNDKYVHSAYCTAECHALECLWFSDGMYVSTQQTTISSMDPDAGMFHSSKQSPQPILFPVMVVSCSCFFLCSKCVLFLLLSMTPYSSVSIVVPAEWSAWSAWSDCSVTCGRGEWIRVRVCGEDAEEFVDERNCQGKPEQVQSCYMSECPVSKAYN